MEKENKDLRGLSSVIPYKWRLQSCSKYYPTATCLAYIDARDVMDLLDEVVGPENWQSDYKEIKGNLYCGVGININNEWVWKWDCGTESQASKEKGEASDAFKRAAVKWGVGRFLYDIPIQYVKTNDKKTNDNYPYPVDDNGNKIKNLTQYLNENSAAGKILSEYEKGKNKVTKTIPLPPAPAQETSKITQIKKVSIDEEAENKVNACTELPVLTQIYNDYIERVSDRTGFTAKCTAKKNEITAVPGTVKK